MPIQKLIVVGMRFQPEAKKVLEVHKNNLPLHVDIYLEDNKEATGGKAYVVFCQGFKLGLIREADLADLKKEYNSALKINHFNLVKVYENYLVLEPKVGITSLNKSFIEYPIENPETCVLGNNTNGIHPQYSKEYTTKKEMTMFEKIVNANKTVAVTAAYMEAGRVANNQVTKLVAAKAPLMVRGYVDTPIGKLVLANLTAMAVEQFRPTDQKLKKVANAMMSNAYQELIQLVDIEGMINELVSSDGIKKALAAVEGQEIQT